MKNIMSILFLTSLAGACSFSQTQRAGFDRLLIAVGKGAASVEVADLNNDGRPDMAVANTTDSNVTILLNQGNRKFKPAAGSPFYAGNAPNDIAFADCNKDGYTDMILANHERKHLTVLLGNGSGQFAPAPHSPFAVAVKPHTHGVAAADFNGDGKIDIVTDSWGVDSIVVLSGDGQGNFRNPVFYATGKHPYQRVRVADFNKDSLPDIVGSDLDANDVMILPGNKKGSFSAHFFAAGNTPFGVAVGDVNADGNLDLAVINAPTISGSKTGNDGLTVLTGDGSGNFSMLKGSPFATGKGPTRVAMGDLNDDGTSDIAITHYNSDFIAVFYMGHNGVLLSSLQIDSFSKSDGIAIFDMDGDGKKDIIVTGVDTNNIMILFNTGK